MPTLSNEILNALKTLNSFINEKRHSELHSVDELNEMVSLAKALRCNTIINTCSRRVNTILLKNAKDKSLRELSTTTKIPFSLVDVLSGYYTLPSTAFLTSNGREICGRLHLSLDIAKVKDEARQYISDILSQNNIKHSFDNHYIRIQSKDRQLASKATDLLGGFFMRPSDDLARALLTNNWHIDANNLKSLGLPDFYFPHMTIAYVFKDTNHEGRRKISGIDIFQRPETTKAVAAKRKRS